MEFYFYFGIWFGYVEMNNMIFGKGFLNLLCIKYGIFSCFFVYGIGYINTSRL